MLAGRSSADPAGRTSTGQVSMTSPARIGRRAKTPRPLPRTRRTSTLSDCVSGISTSEPGGWPAPVGEGPSPRRPRGDPIVGIPPGPASRGAFFPQSIAPRFDAGNGGDDNRAGGRSTPSRSSWLGPITRSSRHTDDFGADEPPGRTTMHPIRAGQRTCFAPFGILLPALMLVVGPSCAPTSGRSDSGERETQAVSTDVRAVAEDSNRFALDLYARLRTGQADNLFFSPASLSAALAMTYAGARGQTAEQMAQVLHFTLPQE